MAEDILEWKTVGKLRYPSKHFGSGSFGFVFVGYYGNKKVAVKRILKEYLNDSRESSLPSEAELMQAADDHPNILRYICTEQDPNFVFIATEWCVGTLGDYVKGDYKGPEIGNEREILRQITQGLAYLHRVGIVHRDIKPNNILIWVPSIENAEDLLKPKLKLADFGLSKLKKIEDEQFVTKTNPHGAEGWMAPELIRPINDGKKRCYTFSVDIFPLGCVFGYVLSKSGKHPFGNTPTEQSSRIYNGKPMTLTPSDLKLPYCNDGIAIELIGSMVEREPSNRLTANQILNHPFLDNSKLIETQGNINNASQVPLARFIELGKSSAQAKTDRDPGMNPLNYVENFEKKLQRKPSTTDDDVASPIPQRTHCFSESNSRVDAKPAQVPSVTPKPVLTRTAALETSEIPPHSPQSDVPGHLFLQQHQTHMSTYSTSPPLSPQSGSSSKSASYIRAGLSPAESQNKLDEAAVASVLTSSTSPTAVRTKTVPVKYQERRYLIKTFANLFKKEEVPKELERTSVSSVNINNDGENNLKPRAGIYSTTRHRRHRSGRESRPNTSMAKQQSLSSASDPLPPSSLSWASLFLSTAGDGAGPRKPPIQERQAARQTELKQLRMAQSIQRELEEMKVKQKELEDQGVRLEKALRGEDTGMSGRDESAVMQEWFQLVHEKNALSRYEQELMVRAETLELEDRHARLHQELKDCMSVDESLKSQTDIDKEEAIRAEMLMIVEQEDCLRSMLEEDRQRYREEDKDLEVQMLAKGLRLTTILP